jgi:hypothetical protein
MDRDIHILKLEIQRENSITLSVSNSNSVSTWHKSQRRLFSRSLLHLYILELFTEFEYCDMWTIILVEIIACVVIRE